MLTVLMATRNRAEVLRQVLDAYVNLRPPLSGWKLVVVDNGSTDETANVVANFENRLPLHFLSEKKLGKNFALNTGLAHVEGDITVLTDDDVFPDPSWLMQMESAASRHPEFSIFGGLVIPRWESALPAWIEWVDQGAVFTLSDPSLREGPIEPHHVFGPNMAIRTAIFHAGAKFDTTIGPAGSSYAMGSETEFVLRLSKQGRKAWYVPGAVVEHFIRSEQLNTKWVLQRAVRFGRGQYRLFGPEASERATQLFGAPRYLFRKLLKQGALIAFGAGRFQSEALFRARWRFNFFRGQIMEARKMMQERAPHAGSSGEVARRHS